MENAIESVSKQLNKYMNFEIEMNDITEMVSTTTSIGKLFIAGARFSSQKRFEGFLKGLGNGERVSEKQLDKLKEYVNNEQRAQFMCEQFDKVVRANSVESSMMMGLVLHDTIQKNNNPSFQSLIIVNALSQLYDADIDNLEYILSQLCRKPGNKLNLSEENYDRQMWVKYFIRNNRDLIGLDYTFEKAMGLQLLKEEIDTHKAKMYADIDAFSSFSRKPEFTLKITPPGLEILNLIKIIKKYE